MRQRLVIFDLDGTLLSTIEDLGCAVNAALGKNGLRTHAIEEYCKMVGDGVRNLVLRALPEGCKEDEKVLEAVLADFFVFYKAAIDVHTRPYPGMVELLSRLQDEGFLLAVASNKFQEGVDALIGGFFPSISFVSVLGNRPGAPLKPSPLIVEEISRSCNGEVDAVMVGDSGTDIATARSAGIPVIAVSWGFRSRETLTEANGIADDAEQLYEKINAYFTMPADKRNIFAQIVEGKKSPGHIYSCCGERFRTLYEFRKHVFEEHQDIYREFEQAFHRGDAKEMVVHGVGCTIHKYKKKGKKKGDPFTIYKLHSRPISIPMGGKAK